jgi:hypothetical protein
VRSDEVKGDPHHTHGEDAKHVSWLSHKTLVMLIKRVGLTKSKSIWSVQVERLPMRREEGYFSTFQQGGSWDEGDTHQDQGVFFLVEASKKSHFKKRVRWFLDLSLKTGGDSGW